MLHWLERPVLNDPVALIAFSGWGDAGEAATQAVAAFLENDPDAIAYLDSDELYDFQVRRPIVEFDESGWRQISWPLNEMFVVNGLERDLIVILGEEPHFRWKAFTTTIVDALRSLGVSKVVCLGAFIGQVAHTLPVPLIGTSHHRDLGTAHGLLPSGYEGPTGILGVLGQALNFGGMETVSVWAAVPHYLSNQEYPPATEALAIKASELLGVSLDLDELTQSTRTFLLTVDEAISGNEELARYIERLEEEGGDEDLSDPVRLVEEIEDFLRDQ